ncbi:MAG TPA: hypothetical protein VKU03_05060, partial [Roseiarcus sp.]|nr:hypothetical protein [Roseiarcus sp.]
SADSEALMITMGATTPRLRRGVCGKTATVSAALCGGAPAEDAVEGAYLHSDSRLASQPARRQENRRNVASPLAPPPRGTMK